MDYYKDYAELFEADFDDYDPQDEKGSQNESSSIS